MDSPNVKVMFRVLTTGAPRLSSVKLVRHLDKHFPSWDIDFYKGKAAYIQSVASQVVLDAQQHKPDFLIVMCDDFGLENAELLGRLPKHNVPVVDCMVPNWQNGVFYWNCYHLNKEGILFSDHPYCKNGITQVYSTATGCCCYRRDVIERFGKDLFFVADLDENGIPKFMGGNDSNLCKQLHRLNIPIFIDNEIQFEHSAVINMKQTMDAEREWTKHCIDFKHKPGIIKYGSYLSSRICVNTKLLGEELPVCDSYKLTEQWNSDTSWVSPPYPPDNKEKVSFIPNNG